MQSNDPLPPGGTAQGNKTIYVVGGLIVLVGLAVCLITVLAVFRGLRSPDSTADSAAATQTAAAALTQTSPASPPTETVPAPTEEPTGQATDVPTAEPTEQACLDKTSVADVTIPDDTVFRPGQQFDKTWTFTNRGDCTWNNEYRIVFVDGDAMGGPSDPLPFIGDAEVAPGESVEALVILVAPQEPGTHRSNWKLQNGDGEQFGWGESETENDRAFWVQIVVEAAEATPTPEPADPSLIGIPPIEGLGDPDWRFNPTINWSFEGDNLSVNMVDGELRLRSPEIIQQDRWFVPLNAALSDSYFEAVFRTAQNCSGGDRYGLAMRVSDDFSQVYAFNVSCNGKFRIYKLSDDFEIIRDWTESDAINAGPEQFNRLGVHAEGESLTFYINGEQVAQFSDNDLSSGRFGYLVASIESENFRVFVTDAAYWNLAE